jgi:hypothetical protein
MLPVLIFLETLSIDIGAEKNLTEIKKRERKGKLTHLSGSARYCTVIQGDQIKPKYPQKKGKIADP